MKNNLQRALEQYWAQGHPSQKWLFFLSWPFALLVWIRRFFYRHKIFSTVPSPCPVIVVGSLVVGGAGKTPVVIALVQALQDKGWRVGVVSRGYGRRLVQPMGRSWWGRTIPPSIVNLAHPPIHYGEEAYLIAEKTHAPVCVSANRAEACRFLYEACRSQNAEPGLDLIISDDGLQHYAMERDIEIVIDLAQDPNQNRPPQAKNTALLPIGPYREPLSRLAEADCVWRLGRDFERGLADDLRRVDNPSLRQSLSEKRGAPIHAVCGIARPERFFQSLQEKGYSVIEHIFPDHHDYQSQDFCFQTEGRMVIMTEKDAIKCRAFAKPEWWYSVLELRIHPPSLQALTQRIQDCIERRQQP